MKTVKHYFLFAYKIQHIRHEAKGCCNKTENDSRITIPIKRKTGRDTTWLFKPHVHTNIKDI